MSVALSNNRPSMGTMDDFSQISAHSHVRNIRSSDCLRVLWVVSIVALKYSIELKKFDSNTPMYILLFSCILFFAAFIGSPKIYDSPLQSRVSISSVSLTIICVLFTAIAKDPNFILPVFAAILIPPNSRRLLIRTYVITSSFFLGLCIIASRFGFLQDITTQRGEDTSILRHSFGFVSPNTVFMFYIPIIMGLYYLSNSMIMSFVSISVILITVIPLYYFTQARSGLIITVLLLCFWFSPRLIVNSQISRVMLPLAFPILTLVSIVIAYLPSLGRLTSAVSILTGRPLIWHQYLQDGVKWFNFSGEQVIQENDSLSAFGTSLDNCYLYTLVQIGIACSIFLSIVYYLLVKQLQKDFEYKLLFIALLFFLYGFSETNSIVPEINWILLLLYSSYFWPSRDNSDALNLKSLTTSI